MDRAKLEWEPTWILPNVVVNPPIESNPFAIVPRTDARVIEFGKRHPPFARFIGKFKNEFHVVGEPSIILLHIDAPPSCRTADCLTAFRNVLAISLQERSLLTERTERRGRTLCSLSLKAATSHGLHK